MAAKLIVVVVLVGVYLLDVDPVTAPTPTIKPKPGLTKLDLHRDTHIVRKALRQRGVDEYKLIWIFTTRSWPQRLFIKQEYKYVFHWSIMIFDFKRELMYYHDLCDFLILLVLEPANFNAWNLWWGAKGDTDRAYLNDFMCCREYDLKETSEAYIFVNPKDDMVKDVTNAYSGDHRRLLTYLIKNERHKGVDKAYVQRSATHLQHIFPNKTFTKTVGDEELQIFALSSYDELKQICAVYKNATGKSLRDDVASQCSSGFQDLLLQIIDFSVDRYKHFARKLHESLHNPRKLGRIVVPRSEIDLGDIKEVYRAMYNKRLVDDIWIAGLNRPFTVAINSIINGNY